MAPLRFGAGVKGKVNQAMAHGLPVVATGCAVEGMHLREGSDVLVADAAEAFAAAQLRASPVDKIVGAFDALQGHVEALDAEGLAVLASCAQQIVLNGFHGKGAEALAIRDAAIAAMG